MGKTFRNGYFPGINSKRIKIYKKGDKKLHRIQYQNECNWIYKNSDNLELNTNFKSIRVKRSVKICDYGNHPFIFGYCTNTTTNLFDISNKLIDVDSENNTYSMHEFIISDDLEKINMLLHELGESNLWFYTNNIENTINNIKFYVWRNKIVLRHNKIREFCLNNMKKQIYRRNKIGYFKGYDKDDHNKHDILSALF